MKREGNLNKEKIGLRIQNTRKSRKMTQNTLAQLTDLSPKYISNIECGYKIPKLETFIAIANVLEVDANSLLVDVLNVAPQITSTVLSERLASLPLSEQNQLLRLFNLIIDDHIK